MATVFHALGALPFQDLQIFFSPLSLQDLGRLKCVSKFTDQFVSVESLVDQFLEGRAALTDPARLKELRKWGEGWMQIDDAFGNLYPCGDRVEMECIIKRRQEVAKIFFNKVALLKGAARWEVADAVRSCNSWSLVQEVGECIKLFTIRNAVGEGWEERENLWNFSGATTILTQMTALQKLHIVAEYFSIRGFPMQKDNFTCLGSLTSLRTLKLNLSPTRGSAPIQMEGDTYFNSVVSWMNYGCLFSLRSLTRFSLTCDLFQQDPLPHLSHLTNLIYFKLVHSMKGNNCPARVSSDFLYKLAPCLQRLNLTGIYFSNVVRFSAFERLSCLRELTLTAGTPALDTPAHMHSVSLSHFAPTLKKLVQLEAFRLEGSFFTNPDMFIQAVNELPRLTRLQLIMKEPSDQSQIFLDALNNLSSRLKSDALFYDMVVPKDKEKWTWVVLQPFTILGWTLEQMMSNSDQVAAQEELRMRKILDETSREEARGGMKRPRPRED